MTPSEVQALQTLAERHGGTLTINPETGQPEANFLKKILPMVAGFALGPAGFGLMSAGMAGAAVGGITALSTGSLSRGLMAGLGAYGGASLGGSLAGAGEGAIAAGDIAAQQAAGTFPTLAEGAGQEAIAKYAADVGGLRDAALSKAGEAGFGAKMSAGLGQMASNPGAYTREMLTGLATISPVLADEGVKTATKRPDTGTIRNYTFDPYGQTYTSAGNYPASEYKGMAQGGIVALAAGGTSYQDLTKDSTPEQIASAYKAFTSGAGGDTQANQAAALQYLGNLGIGQDTIGQAYEKFQAAPTYTQFSNEQIGDYLAANPNADIAAATAQFNADPRAVNQFISQLGGGFLDPTQTASGSGSAQYYDAFSKYGIDANELFAANQALNPGYSFAGDKTATGLARAFDVAGDFKGFNPAGDTQILKDIEWVKKMDTEGANAVDIARLTGLSIGEVQAREAAARAAMVKKIVPGNLGTTTILPGGGLGVSGGGNTVVNKNGTITTRPDLSLGMGQVRDDYVRGGGSLGYVNPAPKTMDEFDQRFNRQTGDSLAAYEYLMGKGANPATQQRVGEIARPYSEAIRGIPAAEGRPTQKYIFQDGKYVENPNYRPMSYDSTGNRVVGLPTAEVIKGFDALKPAQTQANFDYVSYLKANPDVQNEIEAGGSSFGNKNDLAAAAYNHYTRYGKNEGREFTTTATAKPDDKTVFEWADTNNVSDAQLAKQMGISVAEVVKRRAKYKKPEAAAANTTADTSFVGGANGGLMGMAAGGYAVGGGLGALAGGGSTSQYNLGGYSDGGRLLRGPGDGVSDSIPATIGNKQPARLADGEFVIPARIVSELGNGSTEAGARKLYAMMDRVQKARRKTTGKRRVATNTRADKYLPA
jgi:DNA-directed RNA polymerase specialized sigma24 family protein